ncbi:MAG: ABC transporter substrate-binding protein [Tessaracoccus sp.]
MTTTPPIRRGLALVATMTLSGLGLVACAAPTDSVDPAELTAATNETSAFPLTVDDCGATVELEARPERILTVGTAAVELLDAAGASQYIAARTGEFGAGLPEGLSSPPSDDLIVDPADPTTEQIITSDPDLIYGYGLFNADVEQIRDAGIPVLTVQGECGHDATTEVGERGWLSITDDIRRLGAIFGTQSAAEAAAQELEDRIVAVERPATGETVAWVYYFSSEDAVSAYGGTGLPATVLESTGLENVYGDQSETYLTVSTESLLEAQPDWIVLTYGLYGETEEQAKEKFLSEPGISALKAVAEDRIVLVPAGTSSPSPRTIEGLEKIVAETNG